MTNTGQFISDLQAFLEYKKEEGIETLEVSPATLAVLKPVPVSKPPVRPAATAARVFSAPASAASGGELKDVVRVAGKTLEEIAGEVRGCTACPLHQSRARAVPDEGDPARPDILFVCEGPGAEEETLGSPLAGEEGQLLDKMIAAMGYRREEVFIANLVKCRTPGQRAPLPEETETCVPYLKAQIALIKPKVIVALGKTAVQGLLGKKDVAITRFRGTWCTYEGIDLMPTYHPAYLLRSPGKKGETWADLKAVLSKLGKEPPAKK